MNILIVGIQGSGKGTQSEFLSTYYNLKHISTGDVLRQHIADKTPFGLKYEEEYAKGGLAPDSVLFDIVEYETSNLSGKSGYILDGFPRNIAQAEWIVHNLVIDKIIYLVSDNLSTMSSRILSRGRLDDNYSAINRRFTTFLAETVPAINHVMSSIPHENTLLIEACNGIDHVSGDIMMQINGEFTNEMHRFASLDEYHVACMMLEFIPLFVVLLFLY